MPPRGRPLRGGLYRGGAILHAAAEAAAGKQQRRRFRGAEGKATHGAKVSGQPEHPSMTVCGCPSTPLGLLGVGGGASCPGWDSSAE